MIFDDREVHIQRERPLHGNDPFSRNTAFFADRNAFRSRKHTCKNAVLHFFIRTIIRQFFAACCQKDVSFCIRQCFNAKCCIREVIFFSRNSFYIFFGLIPVKTQIGCALFFGCLFDILCGFLCVRVRSIHDYLNAFSLHKRCDLHLIHPAGMYLNQRIFVHDLLAVLCCHAQIMRAALFTKPLG